MPKLLRIIGGAVSGISSLGAAKEHRPLPVVVRLVLHLREIDLLPEAKNESGLMLVGNGPELLQSSGSHHCHETRRLMGGGLQVAVVVNIVNQSGQELESNNRTLGLMVRVCYRCSSSCYGIQTKEVCVTWASAI